MADESWSKYQASPDDYFAGLVRYHVYIPAVDARRLIQQNEYLDELLREFSLIRLGRRSAVTAADYPFRLLEVVDEILTTYSASRYDIWRQAEEALAAGQDTLIMHAMAPVEAAPMAQRFGELLGEIREFSQRGYLLTLPPDDAQAEFNRIHFRRISEAVRDAGAAGDVVPPDEYAAFIASMAQQPRAAPILRGPVKRAELTFEPELAAGSVVRRLIRETLSRWGLASASEPVELPASELISNVVLHARSPGRFVLLLSQGTIRVEVHDLDVSRVEAGEGRLDTATGYGLALVEATSDRWGACSTENGKFVWFETDVAAEPKTVPSRSSASERDDCAWLGAGVIRSPEAVA